MEEFEDLKNTKSTYLLTDEDKGRLKETSVILNEFYDEVDVEKDSKKIITEKLDSIRDFEGVLVGMGLEPTEYYLWHKLTGSTADSRVKYFDTEDKDIENFIRDNFVLETV